MNKKFIVFEGIDGSGKTTQSKMLQEYFISNDKKSILRTEPTNGKIGILIRELLSDKKYSENNSKFNQQMINLFTADRYDNIYNKTDGILKLNQNNIITILDRYFYSTLAYNSNNINDFNLIKKLHKNFLTPDLIIYIDIPLNLAMKRILNREQKDIYETEEKLKIVKKNYDKIFNEFNKNILKIDGTENIEIIHKNIIKKINN